MIFVGFHAANNINSIEIEQPSEARHSNAALFMNYEYEIAA